MNDPHSVKTQEIGKLTYTLENNVQQGQSQSSPHETATCHFISFPFQSAFHCVGEKLNPMILKSDAFHLRDRNRTPEAGR
jgi:hypothetical protein